MHDIEYFCRYDDDDDANILRLMLTQLPMPIQMHAHTFFQNVHILVGNEEWRFFIFTSILM